jgi:hypothetical protein
VTEAEAPRIEVHGWPDRADSAEALRRLEARPHVHPDDVLATVHPSRASADWLARENVRRYGHPTLGVIDLGERFVLVTDLRPAVVRYGVQITDPALPDRLPDPG